VLPLSRHRSRASGQRRPAARHAAAGAAANEFAVSDPEQAIRRSYVTRVSKQRMHQQEFRQRVLRAYREQCAICRLRHEELLDAAHILPDGHPRGEPVVPNGLALCKLHHAAFDRNFLGLRPDLTVELRPDVLREPDGPMLKSRASSSPATRRSARTATSWRSGTGCSGRRGKLRALQAAVRGFPVVQDMPQRNGEFWLDFGVLMCY